MEDVVGGRDWGGCAVPLKNTHILFGKKIAKIIGHGVTLLVSELPSSTWPGHVHAS